MATESTSKFCEGHSEKVDMPDKQSRPMDITRTWAPKDGCLGYFAHDRYGLLPLVCLATATTGRIEKMGDETCIQLRGYVEWDVNEAMKRLDGLTSIMVSLIIKFYIVTHIADPSELNRRALSCNYGTRTSERLTGVFSRELRSC